jgi:hypothetical protein
MNIFFKLITANEHNYFREMLDVTVYARANLPGHISHKEMNKQFSQILILACSRV